jgi:predicted house-cleaning noncanonical NTP pyrophosphatase (MazG superfamily)
MLADIAINDPQGFADICEVAKKGLAGEVVAAPKADAKPVKKEQVKKEVKAELKEELKEEIKEEVKEEIIEEVKEAVSELSSLTVSELKDLAKSRGLSGYSAMKKAELIDLLK